MHKFKGAFHPTHFLDQSVQIKITTSAKKRQFMLQQKFNLIQLVGHSSIVDKSSPHSAKGPGFKNPVEEENLFVSLCIYMFYKKDRNK